MCLRSIFVLTDAPQVGARLQAAASYFNCPYTVVATDFDALDETAAAFLSPNEPANAVTLVVMDWESLRAGSRATFAQAVAIFANPNPNLVPVLLVGPNMAAAAITLPATPGLRLLLDSEDASAITWQIHRTLTPTEGAVHLR